MEQQGGVSKKNVDDEIHVLLVKCDSDGLNSMCILLQSCSFKVTAVQTAGEALSVLTKNKKSIDIMLADTDLPDMDPFELIRQATEKDMPIILMSTKDYDHLMAMKAIDNGARQFLVNPVTIETLRYVRQHVKKDRIRKNSDVVEKNSKVKRKVMKKWTSELHAKFLVALDQFSDRGRCYPSKIHELMNVPGLTRTQVASHLQKYHAGNWGAERKKHRPRKNPAKFGRLPLSAAKSTVNAPLSSPSGNHFNEKENGENMDQSPHGIQPQLVPQSLVRQPSLLPISMPDTNQKFNSYPTMDSTRNYGVQTMLENQDGIAIGVLDFGSYVDGIAPHGLFDLVRNNGQDLPPDLSGLPLISQIRRHNLINYGNLRQGHAQEQNGGQWGEGTSNSRWGQPYMPPRNNQNGGQWGEGTSNFRWGQP